MTDKELLERINNIELREGKERTVKSYVLRNNVISPKSERIIKEHMNHYGFFFEDAPLDYAKLFGNNNPVVIEIGFGNGDTTAEVAIRRPEFNYIGIEVFLQGFVNLLGELGKREIENVRIIRFNAVDVLNHMIPDGSVEGFHIFFPDPWQKKRHHKRRLMNPEFLHLLASKIRKGGYIYMVTDWEEYAEEVLELSTHEELLYNPFGGFAPPVTWRPVTKFEQKGMDSEHPINEIWLERVDHSSLS